MMIDCLIFSKDRACQLELLLHSIGDNFKELGIVSIIYKASNNKYSGAYDILISEYPKHNWILENNLVCDMKSVVNSFTTPSSLILVDDEIVINDFDINYLDDVSDDVHCISLRLNPNITYSHTSNVDSPRPNNFICGADLNSWDWSEADNCSDWGYPSCINSHLYRTEFLKYWVNNMSYHSVNNFEAIWNTHRHNFRPIMCCFNESKTISIANNLTQTEYNNRHNNNEEYSLENLNNKFLEGHRIDTKNMYGIVNTMVTMEREYIWTTK